MKKLLLILLSVFLMFYCGEKDEDNERIKKSAKDINISEINNKCELVDAHLIVAEEILEMYEKSMELEEAPVAAEDEEYLRRREGEMLLQMEKELEDKWKEEGWDLSKAEHCKNSKALSKSLEIIYSWFEVNIEVVKTTSALEQNNNETYEAFEDAKNQENTINQKEKETKESSLSLIDNGAEITILGNENINFGEIIDGEKVDLEFRIKNTGTGDLIITNAKASCGCTQLKFPKEIIKPGNEENISVTFDSTNKTGKQKKTITLTTNATPSIKILTIEGVVK